MIGKTLGHVLSCKRATRLVSRAADERLPAWQRALLRLHLSACAACAGFERQMAFLRAAMRRYGA